MCRQPSKKLVTFHVRDGLQAPVLSHGAFEVQGYLRGAATGQPLQVLRGVAAGEQVGAAGRAAQPLHQGREEAAATATH